MLTKLITYLLAAMYVWQPMNNHLYYESAEDTKIRYDDIANVIASTVLDKNNDPVFKDGDDMSNRVKTGLLLASIASFESSFKKDVESCKLGGDHGLAWGLWQTHSNKLKTCIDKQSQINIALKMINYSFNNCAHLNVSDRLSIYTDGKCRIEWKRSRQRVDKAIKWFNSHKIEALEE